MIKEAIIKAFNEGYVFEYSGKIIAVVESINAERIVYKCGKLCIALKMCDLETTYNRYKGKLCHAEDLKQYNPVIFDTKKNGYSCSCTFFFMLLQHLGLAEIFGEGVKGNPFYAQIK